MDTAASSLKPADSVGESERPPLKPDATPAPSFGLKKLVVLLAAAAGVLLVAHLSPLGAYLDDIQQLSERIDNAGIVSELKFVAIAAVLMAVGAPRLAFYALAGLLFGVTEGFLAAMAASLASSYGHFRLMRWIGRDWVAARFGKNRFFRRVTNIPPTTFAVFLVRQLPVSNLFLNATLALSPVNDRAFVLGSLLGFSPQGIVAILIGAGVGTEFIHDGVVHLILAAAGIGGFALWMALRARRTHAVARASSCRDDR